MNTQEVVQKAIKEEDCVNKAQELVGLISLKAGQKIIYGRDAHNLEERVKKAISDFCESLKKVSINIADQNQILAIARMLSVEALRGM